MTNKFNWKINFSFGKAKEVEATNSVVVVESTPAPTPEAATPVNPHAPTGGSFIIAMLIIFIGVCWWKRTTIAKYIRN